MQLIPRVGLILHDRMLLPMSTWYAQVYKYFLVRAYLYVGSDNAFIRSENPPCLPVSS